MTSTARPRVDANQPGPAVGTRSNLVFACIADTAACAGLVRHCSGVFIFTGVVLTPMAPDQTRKTFGPMVSGGPRRVLTKDVAVARVAAAWLDRAR